MKKVLSIVVAVALVLSCCIVAFAANSMTTCSKLDLKEHIGWQVTDAEADRVIAEKGVDVSNPTDPIDTDTITSFLNIFLDDGCMTESNARGVIDSLKSVGKINDDQANELNAGVDAWVAAHPATDPSSGDSGSGDSGSGSGDSGSGDSGLPFDLDSIKDIFSNLGDLDLSKFTEGAKSSIGQLFDGIKGAGLPDLSSITGLLGNLPGLDGITGLLGSIPGLDMIMGLFGGGDDGGNNGGSTTPSTPSNPSTPSTPTTPGNTTNIPKTADTAPIAAVATLAVVAGVAFVLTRKKNED